ncbi:hypothetical protein HID58_018578, partial [Brassica napus]
MSLCGYGPEAGWVRCIPRDPRRSTKTGLYLHHRMIITLCIHHPYQTGLFSLKRKDTKPIKSGYTLASYLSILVRLTFGVMLSSFTWNQLPSGLFDNSDPLMPSYQRFRLELHSHDFSDPAAIKNFIDRFLEINRASRLQKFKIKYDECNVYLFGISELIAEAINR